MAVHSAAGRISTAADGFRAHLEPGATRAVSGARAGRPRLAGSPKGGDQEYARGIPGVRTGLLPQAGSGDGTYHRLRGGLPAVLQRTARNAGFVLEVHQGW